MPYSIPQQSDQVRNPGQVTVLCPLLPVAPEKLEVVEVGPAQIPLGDDSSAQRDQHCYRQLLPHPVVELLNLCEATHTGVVSQHPSVHIVVQLVKISGSGRGVPRNLPHWSWRVGGEGREMSGRRCRLGV